MRRLFWVLAFCLGCTAAENKGDVDAGEDPRPRLDVSISNAPTSPELGTTSSFVVSLTSKNGFSGHVTLNAQLVGTSGSAPTGWGLSIESTEFDVGADETFDVPAELSLPIRNYGLTATARVTATTNAEAGTHVAEFAINAINQYTIAVETALGQCVYPPAGTIDVSIGTTLRWYNQGPDSVTIHVDPNGNSCPHQADPGMVAGGAYTCKLAGTPGSDFGWYCHSPGPLVNDRKLQPVL
jgi:hypothetical protein